LADNGSCGDINNEVLRMVTEECTGFRKDLIANAIQCGCDHLIPTDPIFGLQGTGSVTISCPDADDTCTPNGSLGGISGSFGIGGGIFTSRDGGVTSTFQEGSGFSINGSTSSATTITCTDGCTCNLTDGSFCDITA
jgi:hypothetical protein